MAHGDFDTNLLAILEMVAREGSVSQAALALGVTAPTVSKALGRLRDHFDDPLFVPMTAGMVPTSFCESLMPQVRAMVSLSAELAHLRPTFEPSRSARQFRLSCSDYMYSVLVVSVIRQLRHAAPKIELCCIETNETTPDLMRSGAIDFAIIPRERQVDDHPAAVLFEDDFSCVVWNDNELVGSQLDLETFLACDHVGTMLGTTRIPHLQDEAFERNGLTPHVAVWAPNFTSVAETLVGTNMIGTMHSRGARLAATRLPLRLLPPPVPFRPFTEMLQWHRRSEHDPGILWLRDQFVAVASALD